MNFKMIKPCVHCPFRKDIRAYLTKSRVREIERSLVRATFPCHETTTHNDDGEYVRTGDETHCAGALILLEKLERPSQMMRIAERLRLYDRRRLVMKSPVFQSFKAMIAAQKDR
jgi:hypothetical protein